MEKEKKSNAEFVPQFQRAFFHPRYWGVWLGVGVMALAAYVPARLRNPVLGGLGRFCWENIKRRTTPSPY